MGSPKKDSRNNIGQVFGNTGSSVVRSNRDVHSDAEVMGISKATGDIKPVDSNNPGFAKASPSFEPVREEKVVAGAEEQKKVISSNTKKKVKSSNSEDEAVTSDESDANSN